MCTQEQMLVISCRTLKRTLAPKMPSLAGWIFTVIGLGVKVFSGRSSFFCTFVNVK
jgi:hypothetical protein